MSSALGPCCDRDPTVGRQEATDSCSVCLHRPEKEREGAELGGDSAAVVPLSPVFTGGPHRPSWVAAVCLGPSEVGPEAEVKPLNFTFAGCPEMPCVHPVPARVTVWGYRRPHTQAPGM